jgi:hypothetical protein
MGGAWLFALALAAPAAGATIANWPPTSFAGGFGEPVPFTSPNPIPYMGQTFTAPAGTLDSLRFVMQGRPPSLPNAGDTIFRLLVTEFTGPHDGQLFRPTTSCGGASGVCFESPDLVVPLGEGDHEFVVPLGGLALNAGQDYFFVFDAWVTRDGIGSQIAVGSASNPGIAGTARSNGVSSGDQSATRADHFAEFWNITVTGDIAYELSYTPVPEPASGALCAAGLVALAAARRLGRAKSTA